MLILRWLGIWLLAGAFVAFIVDGTKSIAASQIVVTPLGQAWFNLHPASLNLLQAVVERYLFTFLWDPVLVNILLMPGWAVLALLGAGLAHLGRKRVPDSVVTNED